MTTGVDLLVLYIYEQRIHTITETMDLSAFVSTLHLCHERDDHTRKFIQSYLDNKSGRRLDGRDMELIAGLMSHDITLPRGTDRNILRHIEDLLHPDDSEFITNLYVNEVLSSCANMSKSPLTKRQTLPVRSPLTLRNMSSTNVEPPITPTIPEGKRFPFIPERPPPPRTDDDNLLSTTEIKSAWHSTRNTEFDPPQEQQTSNASTTHENDIEGMIAYLDDVLHPVISGENENESVLSPSGNIFKNNKVEQYDEEEEEDTEDESEDESEGDTEDESEDESEGDTDEESEGEQSDEEEEESEDESEDESEGDTEDEQSDEEEEESEEESEGDTGEEQSDEEEEESGEEQSEEEKDEQLDEEEEEDTGEETEESGEETEEEEELSSSGNVAGTLDSKCNRGGDILVDQWTINGTVGPSISTESVSETGRGSGSESGSDGTSMFPRANMGVTKHENLDELAALRAIQSGDSAADDKWLEKYANTKWDGDYDDDDFVPEVPL